MLIAESVLLQSKRLRSLETSSTCIHHVLINQSILRYWVSVQQMMRLGASPPSSVLSHTQAPEVFAKKACSESLALL